MTDSKANRQANPFVFGTRETLQRRSRSQIRDNVHRKGERREVGRVQDERGLTSILQPYDKEKNQEHNGIHGKESKKAGRNLLVVMFLATEQRTELMLTLAKDGTGIVPFGRSNRCTRFVGLQPRGIRRLDLLMAKETLGSTDHRLA